MALVALNTLYKNLIMALQSDAGVPQIGLSDSFLELTALGLGLDLALASNKDAHPSRKIPLLRPPSYSDSFLVLQQPTLAPLDVPLSAVRPRFDFVWWYEKCVSLMIHISLISLFETVFFFQFISKSEDSGILKTIDGYVDAVADSCAAWPANVTAVVNDLLAALVNVQNLTAASQVAATGRNSYNKNLQIQSWLYFVGITVLTGAASGWAIWKKYKFHWQRVLIENVATVSLLGVYEFVFFRTIIYNYVSLSMPEIDLHIVTILQGACGLFQ